MWCPFNDLLLRKKGSRGIGWSWGWTLETECSSKQHLGSPSLAPSAVVPSLSCVHQGASATLCHLLQKSSQVALAAGEKNHPPVSPFCTGFPSIYAKFYFSRLPLKRAAKCLFCCQRPFHEKRGERAGRLGQVRHCLRGRGRASKIFLSFFSGPFK